MPVVLLSVLHVFLAHCTRISNSFEHQDEPELDGEEGHFSQASSLREQAGLGHLMHLAAK